MKTKIKAYLYEGDDKRDVFVLRAATLREADQTFKKFLTETDAPPGAFYSFQRREVEDLDRAGGEFVRTYARQ